jgi:site-specific DNA-methyltransferase (adenine-specific)
MTYEKHEIGNGTFYVGDCFDVMRDLPDDRADMVLCDLPYGTTACAWDSVLPFDRLWAEYRRILSPLGASVLTASQPFTSALVSSNYAWFKYALVWEKSRATGHVHAKNKPMKKHEDVLVFSPGTTVHASQSTTRMTYNPQGLAQLETAVTRRKGGSTDAVMAARPSHKDTQRDVTGYPTSMLRFASEGGGFHPTQKPVALFEYLIRTYTDEGMVVLDNCAGSGTTAIAAENAGRRWICIERDPEYAAKAIERIRSHVA